DGTGHLYWCDSCYESVYRVEVDALRSPRVGDGDEPEYRVDGPPLPRMTYGDLLWLFGPELGALRLTDETTAFLQASVTERQFESRAAGLVICRADVAEARALGFCDGDAPAYAPSTAAELAE
ncbi:MAG TPA: hypothetical protein VNL16_07380, partial [Chloroflexota bacterium]|nr:hypothetical protein [Chloroflexota bacterium]